MANELSTQKYTNNQRSVSGTPTIYRDDVTLNCLTASAAVTINLLEIPANRWMTTWRLLVVDYSSNSATNNITIVAPAGFKINGAQQVVIASNGGSFAIQIVNNTNFIGVYSAANTSSSSGGSSYFYAKKLLQTAGTYYATVAAGVRSVLSGADAGAMDSKVESGITGLTLATGIWTVQTTGYYDVGAKMVTRINSTDVESNLNDAGTGYWVTLSPLDGGEGFISIAIIIYRNSGGGLQPIVVTAEKQFVSQNISDVNIECSAVKFPFIAGDLVGVKILNKTNNNIIGMSARPGAPDCYVDFSAST